MKSSIQEPKNITPEIVAEGLNIYHHGYTAFECHSCKKTINLPGRSPGFICNCGKFNAMPFEGMSIPHKMPDLGPSAATIKAAYGYKKKTDPEFRKFWESINF